LVELVGYDKERNAAQFRASKFCFAARVAAHAGVAARFAPR
jgi:hypothetical protein